MKFDDLLGEIGEFGPYQKKVFVLASLFTVTAGYQILSVVFLLEIPDYRCAIPGYDNDTYHIQNSFHEHLVNLTIPRETNDQGETTYLKCQLYSVNLTNVESKVNTSTYACSRWVYDTSVFGNTVITEFNLICGNEIYRSVVTMVGAFGGLVGSLTIGVLGDIIGRKKVLLLSVVGNVAVSTGSAFVTSYVAYTAAGFFFGLTTSTQFMIALVIVMEFVAPEKRAFTGTSIAFFWSGGLLLLNLIAYFVRTWRNLRLALGVPPIAFILMYWLLPESPRWLISRGRYDEAKKIIRRIAESNNVVVEESKLDALTAGEDEEKSLHFWHMLRTPSLIIRTLIIFFTMFTVSLVYFGISINIGNLGGDIYLNFFISAIVDVIATVLPLLLLYKFGRRPILAVSMFIGGLACIASIFPVLYGDKTSTWILTAVAMIGKLGVTVAFTVADIYAVELFPTVVRQSATSMCNVFTSIGGMVAPYIADLGILVGGRLTAALPLIVFGVCSVVLGGLDLLLPETRHKDLPETIEDAVTFGVEIHSASEVTQVNDKPQKTAVLPY